MPKRTLAHKAHTNFESGLLRGSEYSQQASVQIPLLLMEGLATKYLPLPTSAEKPASCATWAPEPVTSLRWVKVVRWLQKVPITSLFVLVVLIKPDTHCSGDTELIVCQNSAHNNRLCLSSCTLKVNGLLTHLGPEISFQELFSTIKY